MIKRIILILITNTIFFSIAYAQIKLKDNSIVMKDSVRLNNEFKNKNFIQLKEITIKNGKIEGFVEFCNYNLFEQKKFHNYFFSNLNKVNLIKKEKEELYKLYEENYKYALKNGIKNMNCEVFKDEFIKLNTINNINNGVI